MNSPVFVEQNAYYDNFSFNYNGNVIDTSKDRFLYIGDNLSYFFIFDRGCNKSLIILKSECSNITATPFEMENILILGLLFS